MKIVAGGIFTETNTFSPIPTGYGSFEVIKASDICHSGDGFAGLAPFDIWESLSKRDDHQFRFGMYASAQPAGPCAISTWSLLRDDLIKTLVKEDGVEVILLLLHGAMVAEGVDDCEGDLLRHLRNAVGSEVVIAVELDLHCHLTDEMIEHSNILISFKEYPHTDIAQRGEELYQLAVSAQKKQCQPVVSVFDCQMLGMYPTTSLPMRKFIKKMYEAERSEGVLSVSFIHGFPYADVPEAGSKMLVVADSDVALATKIARTLGKKIYSKRDVISFRALSLGCAFKQALECRATQKAQGIVKPVVIADQSDNAGAGAPSDSTFALRWLIENKVHNAAVAIIYDPQAVQIAKLAGVGAKLNIRLGGKLGVGSGQPLDILVKVESVLSDYIHRFPQTKGRPIDIPIGDTVYLSYCDIDIIVSSRRCQCYSPSIFSDFGINPNSDKLIVVKSTQHFYAAFHTIASEIIYMSGPGTVPPDVSRLRYQKFKYMEKYPWNDLAE